MNVKLRVLSAGVLFFIGGQALMAQEKDSIKTEEIEEVVVLGYSKVATKAENVTAATTISKEAFENRPTTSFLNSIQGESPGVTINSTSGSPGSAKIDVIVRGQSSINAGTDPLYVIDGMTSNATQYRNLNDADIESVSILRDAQATAVYGNRANNGVIVITTKRARYNAPMRFSYNGSTGVSLLPETDYNLSNTRQYLELERMAGVGLGAGMTDQQINSYPINTNWRDEFFSPGFTQRHDLSMTVGGEKVNLYSSIGYMDQKGTVPTSDFQRFTFRNNLMGKSGNDRFTYQAQVALGFSRRHQLDEETNTGISNNSIQNPLHGANAGLPYLPANQFATGRDLFNAIGTNFNNGANVYVLEDILKGTLPNERRETSLLANLDLGYKLTQDLTLRNKSNVDYKFSETNFARAPWSYLGIAVAETTGVPPASVAPGFKVIPGFEDMAKGTSFNFNSITSLTYDKKIGDNHSLTVAAYLDYIKMHYNSTSQRRLGLDERTWVFGAGTGYTSPVYFNNANSTTPYAYYVPTASANKITAGTLAYFATVDYDYDSKYGVSATIRRDGTYRFTEDNRWGTFWSVGARWNIDKENFMADSGFDMLKLRASYGKTGNQNVVGNTLLDGANLIREVYVIGTGYNNTPGAVGFGGVTNPNLQWEEMYQANIGLDIRTLKRKLEVNLDVYNKLTDLLYNNINTSGVTGVWDINGNNGKLRNRGFEANVRYKVLKGKDYGLTVYGNTSYNRSKVTELIKETTTGDIRIVNGGQLFEWYLAPYVGVNPSNGNALFLDIDNNPTEVLTPDTDQRATGKNMFPVWQGGFGFKADIKNFYLDAHFTYQQGAWKYDNAMAWLYDPVSIGEWNQSADLLDAWTPNNINGSQPSLTATNLTFDGYSDRFLKDASFIRMKNVVLGYDVPRSVLRGTFVKSLKVFVQAENMLTWTKWRGYDPEPNFNYSLSVYPNMKTLSLGTNIEF